MIHGSVGKKGVIECHHGINVRRAPGAVHELRHPRDRFPLPTVAASVRRDHSLGNALPAARSSRSLGERQRREPLGLGDPLDLDGDGVHRLDEVRDVFAQRRPGCAESSANAARVPARGPTGRRTAPSWRASLGAATRRKLRRSSSVNMGTVRVRGGVLNARVRTHYGARPPRVAAGTPRQTGSAGITPTLGDVAPHGPGFRPMG